MNTDTGNFISELDYMQLKEIEKELYVEINGEESIKELEKIPKKDFPLSKNKIRKLRKKGLII